jgi:hypothetical protein
VGHDLYGARVLGERDFRRHLAARGAPELLMMNNFIPDRAGVVSLCREHGINVVHTEDGWFPHYGMGHGDPLGFCWESSLPGLVFRECSSAQRAAARQCRREWVSFAAHELPPQVRPPFVLWPLQLTGDQVNRWDLNVEDWCGLLRHFRMSLPTVFQLVLKPHPRSQGHDNRGVAELLEELPNTVLVPAHAHLKTLLRHCHAVAGANSTVLYEGRLMFHKPAYAYARSWFTNHTELFLPVPARRAPALLNRIDWVEDNRAMRTERLNDYADWFLAQLLARQIDLERGRREPAWFRQRLLRLSHHSYLRHGEDIFANE